MRESTLSGKHQSLGAESDDFNGWKLPKFYSTVEIEYRAAKHAVALMDRPYFGHLRVSGADHVDLLHRLTTNELRKLQPGEGQLNIFTNEKGRIVERFTLQKSQDEMWLMTSAGNSVKVAEWMDKYTFIEAVKVEDLSHKLGTLTLFGPKSPELLSTIFQTNVDDLPDRHFRDLHWSNQDLRISRTEELRLPGFDLILGADGLVALWDVIVEGGDAYDLKPMGEAAYERLRIEAGWPLPQKDYDDSINPHEAQMLPYLDFDKGCYIGQEVVARLDTYDKVQKYLSGIVLEGDQAPLPHSKIMIDKKEVGHITSVTHSPNLQKNIALGYVRTKFISESRSVSVHSNDAKIPGILVQLPFTATT